MGGVIGKFILIALVIAAVWYAFKYAGRIDEIHRAIKRRQPPPGPVKPQAIQAEDLVECRVCGSYVAVSSAKACGRPDCPGLR